MKYDSRIQRWKNFLVKSEKVQKLSSEKEITEVHKSVNVVAQSSWLYTKDHMTHLH